MFLVRLLRWLRGSVTFLVTGAFPERLINLCVRSKLPVWGVKPRPGGCEANTCASNYKRLRPLAKKSGTRVRIQNKRGWPFLRRRYRKRWGLAVGLALAVLLTAALSTRIWSIEVNGCEQIDEREVLAALDELGLRLGVASRAVDARELEQRLMLSDGRIAWIAVNIQGSTATVEINERVAPPDRIDPKAGAANVVAAADGQIKYLEVYEGQPLIQVGDTVSAGEVVVSGVTEDKHGNTRVKYARAKVIAQVYDELDVTVDFEQTALRPAGNAYSVRQLELLGLRVPLSLPRRTHSGELREETESERLWNLPKISLTTTRATPMERYGFTLTPFEAKERAMSELLLREDELLEGCEVLSRELHGEAGDTCFTLTARYLLEKDIALSVEILTE